MDKYEVVDKAFDYLVPSVEGERGYSNLEQLCEVLGYGEGFMRGRAVEEMLCDNPGAVEAVVEFLKEWAVRNAAWRNALEEVLEDEGLLEDAE